MALTDGKRAAMQEALDWCDDNDKSTEFAIAYMQDRAFATFDEVMNFIEEISIKE